MEAQVTNVDTVKEERTENARRIDKLEGHLAEIDESLQLTRIEERLTNLEEDSVRRVEPEMEGEGQRNLRIALADFLRSETGVKAVVELTRSLADGVKEWLVLKTREATACKEVSVKLHYLGLAFSAFVLLMLSILLWHDKITKELAAGLLGSLIGYWYGRDKPRG